MMRSEHILHFAVQGKDKRFSFILLLVFGLVHRSHSDIALECITGSYMIKVIKRRNESIVFKVGNPIRVITNVSQNWMPCDEMPPGESLEVFRCNLPTLPVCTTDGPTCPDYGIVPCQVCKAAFTWWCSSILQNSSPRTQY